MIPLVKSVQIMNVRLFASVLRRSGQDALLFKGAGYVFDIMFIFYFLYSAFLNRRYCFTV